ncbi:glycosyltransferase family 2 protein [Ruegeria sp.]|uniref:glycosyltransferase family 2 protein n=1 Tax=Ruegeria sp. TaxID=1879320 RepID=UPI003B5A025C
MKGLGQAFRAFKHRRRVSAALSELNQRHSLPSTPHTLPGELVVSLTSYPARFGQLADTLRGLLQQSVSPDQTVLWIAQDDLEILPADVTALRSQGLEIASCTDMRSFKKILPQLNQTPNATIVTADDDVYYDAHWLERLVTAHQQTQSPVVCARGHHVKLTESGLPAPYSDWSMNIRQPDCSGRVFPTGVSGVLYAPGCFAEDVTNWELATTLCPTADDVWLYWMHRLTGAKACKFGTRTRILEWELEQQSSLRTDNAAGGNDRQVRAMVEHFGFPPL